jgi:hypothetical protein
MLNNITHHKPRDKRDSARQCNMSQHHKHPEYLKNRGGILREQPVCTVCNKAASTQVDHIVPIDAGGGHDPSNLRGVCAPCNNRLGKQYVTQRNKHRQTIRADALRDHEARFGASCVKAYGRNSVTMPDGSKWTVRAAKPSVGHGTSNDLIVADEIWDMSDLAISGGLIPSMRARKSPLLSCWSTAGTENSTAFLRWREQGLRSIDRGERSSLYFAEWSPPPDLDPMNSSAWAYGNPALGHTLELSTIEAESQNPDRAQFLRASVNLWVASDRGWIPPGVWPALEHEGDIPTGGIVAIETSMDDSRYFGLRAVSLPDRRIVVTVAFVVDSFAALLLEVDRLTAEGCKFAISPSIDIQWPRHLETKKVIVGYGEILKYTPTVRNLIAEKMLLHDGSTQLAEHVQRAVAVRSQGSVAVSSQRSPGPIELCRCMIWAAALCSLGTRSMYLAFRRELIKRGRSSATITAPLSVMLWHGII